MSAEDAFQRFYKTWLEASRAYAAPWMMTSPSTAESHPGTPPPFLDKNWVEQTNALFQRLIWFPPFSMTQGTAGPIIQGYAKYSEILKTSIELYQKWIQLSLQFSKEMAEVIAKLNTRFASSGTALQPSESYQIWLQELTQGMDKILRNEQMASDMAAFLGNALDLKRKADDFMEEYFKMMNLPTRSELDRVYREVYDLKKTLRELKRHGKSKDLPRERKRNDSQQHGS